MLPLITALAASAYHLLSDARSHRQPNPTLATPGAYAETLDQMSHGQQVAELERLCSSLSFHRLAQPDELQLLQQELRRMKEEERQRWEAQAAVSGGASHTNPMELRALEVAEAATEAAVSAVAEAAAAEAAAAAAEAEAFFAAAKAREAKRTEAEATAAEAAAAAAAEAASAAAAEAAAKAEVEAEAAGAAECAAAEVAADAASAAEAAAAEAEAAAADVAAAVAEASATTATSTVRPASPISRHASSSPEVAAPEATEGYVLEREYGRDPRLAPPWITENHQAQAEA